MSRRRPVYRLTQAFLRGMAHLLAGYDVRGQDRIPKEGAFLLAANHKSYLDPPMVGAALPREVCYFAKKQLFGIPIFSRVIRMYGAIPVDREGFDRKGVSQALEILERGEGLLVFPEGTRIRRSGLAEPKEGISLLALRSGAPVVPALILSTWEPRRSIFRRIPIRVRFGSPLHFGKVAPGPGARARYPEVARRVMEAIRALAEEEERLQGHPGSRPGRENQPEGSARRADGN